MLSHIEVPILVDQIERAAGYGELTRGDRRLLSKLKRELLEHGTRAAISEEEIEQLDEIFRVSGLYAAIDADEPASAETF